MSYQVADLLKMPQAELDALFTASEPGPIPAGEAQGTAIVAPGTSFGDNAAAFVRNSSSGVTTLPAASTRSFTVSRSRRGMYGGATSL